MLTQRQKISPPIEVDKQSLQDFASVTQQAFDDVFQSAHIHPVKTSAPAENEGQAGDIFPVALDGVAYLYIKFPSLGWKRILLT